MWVDGGRIEPTLDCVCKKTSIDVVYSYFWRPHTRTARPAYAQPARRGAGPICDKPDTAPAPARECRERRPI